MSSSSTLLLLIAVAGAASSASLAIGLLVAFGKSAPASTTASVTSGPVVARKGATVASPPIAPKPQPGGGTPKTTTTTTTTTTPATTAPQTAQQIVSKPMPLVYLGANGFRAYVHPQSGGKLPRPGDRAVLWDTPDQLYTFEPNGSIKHAASGLCLAGWRGMEEMPIDTDVIFAKCEPQTDTHRFWFSAGTTGTLAHKGSSGTIPNVASAVKAVGGGPITVFVNPKGGSYTPKNGTRLQFHTNDTHRFSIG